MLREATLSNCGRYRYDLTRQWSDDKLMTWVMLNPSTADAYEDDATIRKCIRFAHSWGFGGFIVVNLFAFRATEPSDLLRAFDPIGPDNNDHIRLAAKTSTSVLIVCAGGNEGRHLHRYRHVASLTALRPLYCLKTTKHGQPWHPLYVRNATHPQPWSPNDGD